jgi:hypothetical protein
VLWTTENSVCRKKSLGEYVNFPVIIHGIVNGLFTISLDVVQLSIIRALHNLNGFVTSRLISVSGKKGMCEGIVGFEIGVADGANFHNLDKTLADKLSIFAIQEKLSSRLDFLVTVTYHYYRRAERIPLHFDYHQLRFSFDVNVFELRLFHSKGTRRMPLDELLHCILSAVNEELEKQSMKPLIVQTIRVL